MCCIIDSRIVPLSTGFGAGNQLEVSPDFKMASLHSLYYYLPPSSVWSLSTAVLRNVVENPNK